MNIVVAFLLALISLGLSAEENRQIIIPQTSIQKIANRFQIEILSVSGEFAMAQLPAEKVAELSAVLHEERERCGGFIDVTDELKSGNESGDIFKRYTMSLRHSKSRKTTVSRNLNAVQLVENIDALQLASLLTELASFDDRASTSESGAKAAQFLFAKASEIGRNLNGFTVRTVATRGYPKQPSVVATWLGRNPSLPHIVVGAHMDTLPFNKPGADDDASGCAVVMEALRAVAQSGKRFEKSIDFVWYAAEEMGLVGSTSVVRDFQKNRIAVGAAMQFDMVGWVNPLGLHDLYLTDDFTDPTLNQALEAIINTYLPQKTVGHARCGYSCSDHASWTFASVPAVYPFESHHDEDNPFIHTSDDKIDVLNMEHAATFAKIAVAFLSHLANLEQPF